ncbi:PREDICTED: TRAF-interacting protein with FHA domain-containing protein B [Chrysochloris asiatica]|uniref:TRAF-interacting protein with FHA domain-containing protein B n=1 Tax=Chrysochloris asiatica TaxID=185453 RepID=A0A9B0TK06_CHRAS|nr:PREDICTED: TRAF-interacting protein with FHA domain-containing protein B [Chrysochloris asiatica]
MNLSSKRQSEGLVSASPGTAGIQETHGDLSRGSDLSAPDRSVEQRPSRHHLSPQPYQEKGSTLLSFCLKALSSKGCVWVNRLMLRYLEQVLLSATNKVAFSGIQMMIHMEEGISLKVFAASTSVLIYRLGAEDTDEYESIPQQQPPPGSSRNKTGAQTKSRVRYNWHARRYRWQGMR